MSTLGFHLRIRLEDDRVIAPTPEERRVLARVVLEQGRRDRLGVFSAPDNHLHLWSRCSREQAGALCRRLGSALRQKLGISVPFKMRLPKAIRDQWHLERTVRYVLRQHMRHRVVVDRAREAAALLGVSPRAYHKMLHRPVDGALVQAIRRQLGLTRALRVAA